MKIAVTGAARPLLAAPAVDVAVTVDDEKAAREQGLQWLLYERNGALTLASLTHAGSPLSVDFSGGPLGWRLERVRHELLVRACGAGGEETPSVLDATAGFGRDAALLAAAGCPVVMLERHPVLHSLLADGLRRAKASGLILADRLELVFGDSLEWLAAGSPPVDVVYLDPMFPVRRKSAAVKKEQQWLQQLAAAPSRDEERRLLRAARQCAGTRVVVKRPLRAEWLAGEKPHHSLSGSAIRFDIYAGRD